MTGRATTAAADDMSLEMVKQQIILLRGQKILLDGNLATLYGVPTKRFNEQIKRNLTRFPSDFMFQLTDEEFSALRSQFATLKGGAASTANISPMRSPNTGRLWPR